jgi:hypothetical protein
MALGSCVAAAFAAVDGLEHGWAQGPAVAADAHWPRGFSHTRCGILTVVVAVAEFVDVKQGG